MIGEKDVIALTGKNIHNFIASSLFSAAKEQEAKDYFFHFVPLTAKNNEAFRASLLLLLFSKEVFSRKNNTQEDV